MMAIMKTASESSRTWTPWVANPSYRRQMSLPTMTRKTSWTNMKTASESSRRTSTSCVANSSCRRKMSFPNTSTTASCSIIHILELLASNIKPIDTGCVRNINGHIPIISETIDSTKDNIRSSSKDKAPSAAFTVAPAAASAVASSATASVVTAPNAAVPVAAAAAPTATAPDAATVDAGFKSYIDDISTQQDIEDELCLPLSYQFMFDKRTSPWEMKDWDQDQLNTFVIQAEKIDRLYHMVANDEDQNFRSWEICCRMDYEGEKYFVELYANCDYTGFDCQGGGYICITKLPDFFLNNMVTMDQNPDQVYKALVEDDYNVQEPDPLHKMHPKFWNNVPMLKYLCHNAIYKNKDILSHFKEHLPKILANSVDDFIKVKEWENE